MQEITRNVSNLDRGPIDRVPVERVYEAVKGLGEGAEFASREVAEVLGVAEYKVRASVAWLLKRNLIETAGEFWLRSKPPQSRPYSVQRYRLKPGPGDAPDFSLLMAAFCR